jgi:hypothetical protein
MANTWGVDRVADWESPFRGFGEIVVAGIAGIVGIFVGTRTAHIRLDDLKESFSDFRDETRDRLNHIEAKIDNLASRLK